jgi:hypothetical protein
VAIAVRVWGTFGAGRVLHVPICTGIALRPGIAPICGTRAEVRGPPLRYVVLGVAGACVQPAATVLTGGVGVTVQDGNTARLRGAGPLALLQPRGLTSRGRGDKSEERRCLAGRR